MAGRERSPEQANSFGRAVDEYERARPRYPDAAIDWVIPAGARVALDLGAGTGKFTRSLVARGLEVTAVEPDDVMRVALSSALPTVRAVPGTGEEIPLPDRSVDVVTVAQAWHWMDPARATAEIARVLRPGGTIALVWNIRDETVAWVQRLSEIMGSSEAERFVAGAVEIGAPFGPLETHVVEWSNEIDGGSLVSLVASRSYLITADEERRTRVLDAVRELVATDPALAGRERFELPYKTMLYRARLPAAPID
ncbi:MAG: ycgJ 1 [Microbacteriaceae bacterium]|nr:ycgJ 1 [Microbacteriaceae bacterium]